MVLIVQKNAYLDYNSVSTLELERGMKRERLQLSWHAAIVTQWLCVVGLWFLIWCFRVSVAAELVRSEL